MTQQPLGTGPHASMDLLLEPEEAALIVALRERLGKVETLYQESEAERREWEATHDPEDFYVALDHKGAAAYGECVEAMTQTALDAFNLVAKALNVSGWQASCAELEFLGRSRRIEGPWGIYTMADALYPQYDVLGRLNEMRHSAETVTWLGDCAEFALATKDAFAAPAVSHHWRLLVAERDLLPATDKAGPVARGECR